MGHHGWNGDPPITEALARERLIASAATCLDRSGAAKVTLSDVALESGVTRQTVYRYFAGINEVLQAVAAGAASEFVASMRAQVAGFTAPVDAVVEAIAFCLRELPREPRIGALLQLDDDLFGRGITSVTGSALGTEFLRSLDVDWASAGIAEAELDELAELMLRLIGSLMQFPAATPRDDDQVRAFVRRWIGPGLGVGH